MFFKIPLLYYLIISFITITAAAEHLEQRQLNGAVNTFTSDAAAIVSQVTSVVGGGAGSVFETVTSAGGEVFTIVTSVAGSAGSVATSFVGSVYSAATASSTSTHNAAVATPSFGLHAISLVTVVTSALVGAIITL